MKKIILAIIFISILDLLFAHNYEIDYINNLKGKEKWESLKKLIIKERKFGIPPNTELMFMDNNLYQNIGYKTNGQIVKKNGYWEINSDKGFFYIKLINLWIDNFTEYKMESFFIDCQKGKKRETDQEEYIYCSILLSTENSFIYPKNFEERFSGKYLQISLEPIPLN